MSHLREAIEAAEERKQAAFGDAVGIAAGEFEGRAIFSGFDIDHDELNEIAIRAGQVFHSASFNGETGPRLLLSSAWTEGFLVGLMYGLTPPPGNEDG